MWLPKLIQSPLTAGVAALVLLVFGCAPADRNEPAVAAQTQRLSDPADARHATREDDIDDDDGEDDDADDMSSASAAGASPSPTPAAPSVPKSDPMVTTPPSLDELPNLKPQRARSIAARIDVKGSMETTRRPVVPSYRELPLTEEEKRALGKDREKPDDIMAFYKPQPSIQQGVSPRDRDLQVAVGGRGGASVGIGRSPPRVETFGVAGRYAESSGLSRKVASVDVYVPVRVRVGPSFVMQIGWGLPRTGAAQMPYLEP
jgi:hypothetical protein